VINDQSTRPHGLSAFIRCKNEAEFILASILSCYRVFDEIIVVVNNSTDDTSAIVQELIKEDYKKIKLFQYGHVCASTGPDYLESVKREPNASLAQYYNWCLEKTSYSHVCKWDGDMIALESLKNIRNDLEQFDVITFDGHDPLGEATTSHEPRIFRYNLDRARYVDWDLYEILDHNYARIKAMDKRCYVHMKLLKKEWLGKEWRSPNDHATRPFPASRPAPKSEQSKKSAANVSLIKQLILRFIAKIRTFD